MPGWGDGAWGTGVWAGDGVFGISSSTSGTAPYIINRYPNAGQINIRENSIITVQFFDNDGNLDNTSLLVYINGVVAYSGITGFSTGYIGTVDYSAGSAIVQLTTLTGFNFGQVVTVRGIAADTTPNTSDETWHFIVRDNPTCYSGLAPTPLEIGLQSPFTTFIGLEFLRTLMFDIIVKPQRQAVINRGNKAARAIAQLAYATELSTLQNAFALSSADTLDVKVCEKQSALRIDSYLQKYIKYVKTGIESMRAGGLNDDYVRALKDYSDSSLYIYRVSLVANMLLFAKSTELQQ